MPLSIFSDQTFGSGWGHGSQSQIGLGDFSTLSIPARTLLLAASWMRHHPDLVVPVFQDGGADDHFGDGVRVTVGGRATVLQVAVTILPNLQPINQIHLESVAS